MSLSGDTPWFGVKTKLSPNHCTNLNPAANVKSWCTHFCEKQEVQRSIYSVSCIYLKVLLLFGGGQC